MLLLIDTGFAGLGAALHDLETDRFVLVKGITTKMPPKKKRKGLHQMDFDSMRVQTIITFLDTLLGVRGAVLEMPFSSQNAKAARAAGLSVGLVVTWLTMKGIPFEQFTPQSSKKAATGNNHAEKEEVFAAVNDRWPDVKWPIGVKNTEDAGDAAALMFVAEQRENGIVSIMKDILKRDPNKYTREHISERLRKASKRE
jgi:Holliday junction resolvasome RuvABC endonuclease subunit